MSACTLFWQFGRLVQSVLTISWLISVQYPVMAGADCDPLCTLWSGKGTPELIRLRNLSSAPLLPSTWSAFQRVCFQWTLLTHMSALYDSSGPWAPTYKVRKEISCLSPWQWCKRPQVTLSTLPFHITLPALGPIPKSGKKKLPHRRRIWVRKANHAFVYQRSDYSVGCYLSVGDSCAGWQHLPPWVMCEAVWKTRINRGPGIVPDRLWPPLLVDPMGET